MNKLTIAAAVAAMSAATFAAQPEAQVYDVSLTIKTTKAAEAKNITNKVNPVQVTDKDAKESFFYRAQTSITWKGLIWGCDCEAIDGVWENAEYCGTTTCTVKGCVIWDTKGKTPVYFGNDVDLTSDETLADTVPGAGFGWKFLQSIGKDAKSLECCWEINSCGLVCDENSGLIEKEGANLFNFTGAGFGTAKLITEKTDDLYTVECESYVSSISGNFAGYMLAPYATKNFSGGCAFCGGYDYDACAYAEAWAWCEDWENTCQCDVDLADLQYTAAYGTWSIKYNSSLSKKLTKVYTIRDAYNFKSLPTVAEKIEIAEKASNTFRVNYIAATKAVAQAESDLADAQEDQETAAAAVVVAEADASAKAKQFAAAGLVYTAQTQEAYDIYKANYTATYGAYLGDVTYWTDWTNKTVAAKNVIAAEEYATFVTTNDVPKAEKKLATAKKNLAAAEADLEYCIEQGACDYCD